MEISPPDYTLRKLTDSRHSEAGRGMRHEFIVDMARLENTDNFPLKMKGSSRLYFILDLLH